jgi:hypothetical protein
MRLPILLAIIALGAGAEPTPDAGTTAAHDELPIHVYVAPGRWRRVAPMVATDPIEPLSAADEMALAKPLDAKACAAFIAGYVDRIETHYRATAAPSADFLAWLAAHPDLRRDFWLALSWRYDDPAGAIRTLDRLRTANPKAVERFSHLAIAVAVVHDTPDAVTSSRYACIWGVTGEQFAEPPNADEVFAWFSDERRQAQFIFKPNQLSWGMMVHLVDVDLSAEDRQWSLAQQAGSRKDLAALYPLVPYDDDKLARRPTRLGSRPYSLPNLLAFGGVCGDQGHFASRVAKAFGVPAMKVGGEGRWGGAGHAWCGYLTAAKGRPVLEFTGRYQYDYYYTGDIFDPQTRTMTLDRYVALGYDGLSLSFARSQEADALARAALGCEAAKPTASLALAKEALKRNQYCADAWRVLLRHSVGGTLPRKEAQTYVARMFKDLAQHPDLTIEGLGIYLRGIPASDVAERQRLYAAAYGLYATRPDLQVALRMVQCSELVAAEREPDALRTALDTVVRNASEGTLILPLVEYVVETSRSFAQTNPSFRLAMVKQQLAKVEETFPKARGSEVSPAWVRWQELMAGW